MRRIPRGGQGNSTTAATAGMDTTRPDPEDSARAAGLRYTTDTVPGIQRIRHGASFRYVGPDKKVIRNSADLQRIRSLVIPPAWTEVWISPDPRGHLQATGRDARGRKQYRYHARWREVRDETKYHRMIAFAQALATIRRRTCDGPGAPQAFEGEGARGGRAAPREDADPGGQRRVRQTEPLVRPDDDEGWACGGERWPRAASRSGERAASSTRST